MSSEETVTFNLELDTMPTRDSVQKLNILIYRTLALMRRFGLPEAMDDAIAQIMKLVYTIRMLIRTIHLLELASGPVGWALFAVSAATVAFETGEFIMTVGA